LRHYVLLLTQAIENRLREEIDQINAVLCADTASSGQCQCHEITWVPIVNLATVLHCRGKSIEAVSLLQTCVERFRKSLSGTHVTTLQASINLVLVLASLNRDAEAIMLAQDYLAECFRSLGKMHNSSLRVLHLLASLYQKKKQFSTAELLYKEALKITRAIFGDSSEQTFTALFSLASSLRSQGKLAEAEPVSQFTSDTLFYRGFKLTVIV